MKKIILSILFLIFSTPAFSVCTPDLTVCPSGCDYSVLNDAVTDLETNCSTPTSNLSIAISGDWSGGADTTQTDVSISMGSYTLTIYTTGSARHNGTVQNQYYRLMPTNVFYAYSGSTSNLITDGLIFSSSNYTYAKCGAVGGPNTSGQKFKNNICFKGISGYSPSGITSCAYGSGGAPELENNLFYGFDGTGTALLSECTYGIKAYNNTITKSNKGLVANGSNDDIQNNISYGNTTDYSGTAETHATNISSDTTSPDAAFQSITLSFVDYSGNDFHLSSSDTDAINQGTDLSSIFTTDIDGDTRDSNFDIGMDEYIGGTPPATPKLILIK